jgi:hypothetical protein
VDDDSSLGWDGWELGESLDVVLSGLDDNLGVLESLGLDDGEDLLVSSDVVSVVSTLAWLALDDDDLLSSLSAHLDDWSELLDLSGVLLDVSGVGLANSNSDSFLDSQQMSSLLGGTLDSESDDLGLSVGWSLLQLDSKLDDSSVGLDNSGLDLSFSGEELNFLSDSSDLSVLDSDLVSDSGTTCRLWSLGLASVLLDSEDLDSDSADLDSSTVVSSDENSDLLGVSLDNLVPSSDSFLGAWAWLSSDDDLASLLANSDSSLELDEVSSGLNHLSFVGLSLDLLDSDSDLSSPDLDLLLVATASFLDSSDGDSDWLAGSLASDDSSSDDSDSVLGNDLSSGLSGDAELSLDSLATAWLVSDDHLSGLLADSELGSESDNSLLNSDLSVSSDGDSDSSAGSDSHSPSLDGLSAATA